MYEVVYYSREGNTKKVADAIAEELGVVAQDVKTTKEPDKGSFLFLGSGCYVGKPGKELMEFIKRCELNGRRVALFGTSASPEGKEIPAMEKALIAKGAKIVGKFYCEGKFLFFNRKHPDSTDLENARKFVREMMKS